MKSLCTKELYCTFLRVTCQRYSALSLSDVSSVALSHDSVSRWLEETHCQPKDIWNEARKLNWAGGNARGRNTILSGESECSISWGYIPTIKSAPWTFGAGNRKRT